MTRLVPQPLFNDAVDTERAAAADYFPSAARLTLGEQVEAKLEETAPIDNIEEARRTGTDAYVSHLITSRKIKEYAIREKLKKKNTAVPSWSLIG